MAQKRMFDKAVIDTDRFMDLPVSAKALYFLLGMEADDEGFVSYKKVIRIHGGNEDDIKVLQVKNFVIKFETGVVVITDWRKNNWLDSRRIKPTEYVTEKEFLAVTKDNKYMLSDGLADVKPEEYRGEENRESENQNFPPVRVSFEKNTNKKGEPLHSVDGNEYTPDGWSPLVVKQMRKRLEKSLGLKRTNKWSEFLFGTAWDFLKAFEKYQGYKYPDNVLLDEVSKNLSKWYEIGETRESIREMLIAFFEGKKSEVVTITPNSVFSSHTFNSWKQNKL